MENKVTGGNLRIISLSLCGNIRWRRYEDALCDSFSFSSYELSLRDELIFVSFTEVLAKKWSILNV